MAGLYNLAPDAKEASAIQYLSRDRGRGYTILKDSIDQSEWLRALPRQKSKSSYLYNAEKQQFITYDDEWSVKKKCQLCARNKKWAG